jgi:CRISPR/Cas system-associated exonuclease Cas4 (RecB family)
MSEKYVRASDITNYIYCRRSWWLENVAGQRPQDDGPFARGTTYHRQHGRLVRRSIWGRRIAIGLFFVVVAIFTFLLLGGG